MATGAAGPGAAFGAPFVVRRRGFTLAMAGAFEPSPASPSRTALVSVPDDVSAPTRPPERGDITHAQIIELYAQHHDSLLRFASLVAPENGMAEDLVQEAFVRLYKSWRNIRDDDKVAAYLRSTIANLARGRGRRLVVASRHRPAPAPDAASAEEGVLRLENQSEVVAMLRLLPARQRECLVLRYYEGQTESEIAATLGISIGSVRTHTTRAMASLQRHFGVAS